MPDSVPLPAETIASILLWLGPLDILRCRLVSRSFRGIIDSSPELQFLFKLHSFGYTASPRPRFDIPCKDRVTLFQKFQQNWTSNSATPVDTYALEPVDFGTSDKFCNGVYARGSSLPGIGRTCRLDLCQLPSVIKGTPWRQWSHPDLGVQIDDFAIEPEYDLLVLLVATTSKPLPGTGEPHAFRTRPDIEQAFTIHLHSLETNLPHSLATRTELKCIVSGLEGEAWSFRSQVVGNYLAVMFLHTNANPISYLIVWDWVIGQEVTHIDSGFSAGGSGASSFTFLSDHLILVPSNLVPFEIDPPSDSFGSNQGRLDIYTFEDSIDGASVQPARRLVSLILPAILPGLLDVAIVDIDCQCNPAPLVSNQVAARLPHYPRAFRLSHEKRVVCITITLMLILDPDNETFWNRKSDLYIPVPDLLKIISHLPVPAGNAPYIRWGNWDKRASFVDTSSLYSGSNFKQHSQRSVYAGGPAAQLDGDLARVVEGLSLTVLSFDPDHVRRKLFQDGVDIVTANPVDNEVLGGSLGMAREYFRQAYVEEEYKADAPFIVRITPINEVIHPGYKIMIDDEHVVIVSVCRLLREVIESSAELQYLVELDSFGYIPPANPRLDLSYKEKLSTLKQHQDKWRSDVHMRVDTYRLRKLEARSMTYDFHGGIYVRGSSLPGMGECTRRLDVYQLPSVNKGIEWREWSHPDLGIDVRDFALQTDYDLLILLEADEPVSGHTAPLTSGIPPDAVQYIKVHLRSLETGRPHPLAMHPILECQVQSYMQSMCTFYAQVVGKYLAVFFQVLAWRGTRCYQIRIWDWTTGKLVSYVEPSIDGAESFTFLSDQLILIPCPVTFTSDGQLKHQARLDVYKFDEPSSDDVAPKPAYLVASFGLLELSKTQTIISRFSCRCDPAPSPSARIAVPSVKQPRIFDLASDNRVLCIAIEALNSRANLGGRSRTKSMLYISFMDLLGAVKNSLDEHAQRSGAIVIPWEDWAKMTSWVDVGNIYTGNQCYVYGQRTVGLVYARNDGFPEDVGEDIDPDDETNQIHSLLVFDFDPVRVKQASQQIRHGVRISNPETENTWDTPMEETKLMRDVFLGGESKANKPFSVRTTLVNERFHSPYCYVMIDEEHVGILMQDLGGRESSLVVYTFN